MNVNSVKEAWDILPVTHEGTKRVKTSKLQMLTIRFEDMTMGEDETFNKLYARLNDIVNSSFNLEEKIDVYKVVRKILRFLPKRFMSKITAIEESKDVDTLRIVWVSSYL